LISRKRCVSLDSVTVRICEEMESVIPATAKVSLRALREESEAAAADTTTLRAEPPPACRA
jgi:hypothetical protein